MPSGAKKRKAKKKKEIQPNTQPNTSSLSHGDNLKHQDDKESDVGEVNSPASHDHHNILVEGEQEKTHKEQNIVVKNETSNQIEREFKIEDESTDNPERNTSEGGSSGSSSCSNSGSDDESVGVKHTPVVMDISPHVDSVKAADLLPETPAEPISSATIEKAGVSAVETLVVDEIVPLVEKEEVQTSSLSDSPVIIQEIESLSKENGEEMVSCVADTSGILPERKEEEMVIQSVDNITAFSDPKECVVPVNEDRLTLSPDAPGATFDNGAEHVKDSGITQPLLGDHVQKASWKSCCGLFELFSPS